MEKIHFETEIWLGAETLVNLATLKKHKIFVVADPFLIESNQIEKVTRHLGNFEYQIFSDIVPDPPIEKIINGLTLLQQFQADTILAIGGGSAIDAGKAMKYFANRINQDLISCFIAIPTTSGTGSEVTDFSVLTLADSGTKYPLVTAEIQPNIAILDVDLVMGVPPKVTADTGMDVLTHIIEAYVSTEANEFSDAFCEKAIQLVFEYLPRAYQNGDDYEARKEMHLASCMAGMAFNLTSLGLNHGIAHAAGAKLHIPHGRINAILLPTIIKYNAQLDRTGELKSLTAKKYLQLANCLKSNCTNPRIGVKNLIRKIEQLRKSLNMPQTLTEFGISKQTLKNCYEEIAEAALQDGTTRTNPVQPTIDEITKILISIT